MRVWIMSLAAIAGLYGAAGVGLAAAGAHLTGGTTLTTAAYFLLFHAGALVAFCAFALAVPRAFGVCLTASGIALGAGLFSGDLALRGLAAITLARFAAPTGGMILILSWLGAALYLPLAVRAALPPR